MSILKFYTGKGQIIKIDEDKEIHRGGEGRILIPENIIGKVAKLYHENVKTITLEKFKSLQMIKNQYFVLPEELLFDKTKQIKGFLMKFLSTDYFPIASMFNKNFCIKNNITEKLKNNISENLIEVVKTAHYNKLIIGDLNQYNILVTKNGDLKIIDTDSFATDKIPHSGVLLEDIRDYLYNGNVNYKSDFFALSVIIFNLFTFTHPFKGIHKKYKSLSERMINKKPVFVKDAELTVPKCFTAISDSRLQNQFEAFYLNGERYIINLDGVINIGQSQIPVVQINKIEKNNLVITRLFEKVKILDINFNNNLGYIETEIGFIIYNSENKGFISKITEIDKTKAEQIFIGTKNILMRRGEKMFFYLSENEEHEIKNFTFPLNSIIKQYENILMILTDDILYKVELDKVVNNSIQVQRTNVFGKGFKNATYFIQTTGGIQRLFYNTGKDMSNVKLTDKILDIKQKANYGIVQYSDNNKILHKFVKINGLQIEETNFNLDYFVDFAYLKSDKDNGYIFITDDNMIKIIRTNDFAIISELECEFITQQTKLEYTKSGILALENGNLFLINNK